MPNLGGSGSGIDLKDVGEASGVDQFGSFGGMLVAIGALMEDMEFLLALTETPHTGRNAIDCPAVAVY